MRLEITIEGQKPYLVEVHEQTFTVGRSEKNFLRISSETISRTHLRMRLDEGKVFITDMGSANGTYVDGEKLTPHQEIQWQTFFSLNLSSDVSIAIRHDTEVSQDISNAPLLNTTTKSELNIDSTRYIPSAQKKPAPKLPPKKLPQPQKRSFTFLIAIILIGAAIYFQTVMNQEKVEEIKTANEAKLPKSNSVSGDETSLKEARLVLNELKCQVVLEKDLCDKLKIKSELNEGVSLKNKSLIIFYNFTERIRNVELDPSFSFAYDKERQLYLMTFMLFRPDLRDMMITNGFDSLTIVDITSSPLKILKTVSINSQDLSKLTMIDIETIFTNLLHKQDNTLFKNLVLGVIKQADAN